MGLWGLGRLTAFMGAAVLASGCGGQTGSPVPQGATAQARVHPASGSSNDLLYAFSNSGRGTIVLHSFTFPGLQHVKRRFVFPIDGEICSDADGHLFMPFGDGTIREYDHYAKQIATLQDAGYIPTAWASDPTTGNLAVPNDSATGPGNLAIYPAGSGTPSIYSDAKAYYYGDCSYDGNGNLFVWAASQDDQLFLIELPKGSSTFQSVTVDKPIRFGAIQWDGEYLVVLALAGQNVLYRVKLSGSTGSVVDSVILDRMARGIRHFWIQGNVVAATGFRAGLWRYPKGGRPLKVIGGLARHYYRVTVSVAPSH